MKSRTWFVIRGIDTKDDVWGYWTKQGLRGHVLYGDGLYKTFKGANTVMKGLTKDFPHIRWGLVKYKD